MGFRIIYYIIPTLLALFGIRKYRESYWGVCRNKIKLRNKVAIVTGANSGIGFEIAKELAKREAHVIMACRSMKSATKCIHNIKQQLSCSSTIIPMKLDLASLASVRKFAADIKSTYTEIHLLINNAGVAYPNHKRCKTQDNFEIHMGVNYLGHFFLTRLLLELLANAESSRIIIITSALHERGQIYLDDLNLERVTEKTNRYANSKLANVYHCLELAKRTSNTGIKVYAVSPGWVYTKLFRHSKYNWYQTFLFLPVAFLFMRTAKQGAQTAIYCATEPSLDSESGSLYRDCKRYIPKMVYDDYVSQKLWEVSERLISKAEKGVVETESQED